MRLVVLLLEDNRAPGHGFLRSEEETVASHVPARLSPFDNGAIHLGVPQISTK